MSMREFNDASKAHLKRLDSLIERGSVPRLRRMYEQAISHLQANMARSVRNGAAPFTLQQHQALLAQARQGMARISVGLGTALGQQAAATQEVSARALIADIKRLERKARGADIQLPIEQAARFAGVVDKRRTSMLRLNKTSMVKYGAGVVSKMERAMGQSLLTGETGYKAIDRITDVADMEWWRAERIVRTETAWAYNATQADAIADSSRSFPDLMMRWTEYVADVTLQKMDSRVGDDSCAMHGQLARPGDLFYMPTEYPAHLNVSPSLVGMSWSQPPNRPNDRAALQPWRPGWGWGWVCKDGLREPPPTAKKRGERVPEITTELAEDEVPERSEKRRTRPEAQAVSRREDEQVPEQPTLAQRELAEVEAVEAPATTAAVDATAPLVPTAPGTLPGVAELPGEEEGRIGFGRIVSDEDVGVVPYEETPEWSFGPGSMMRSEEEVEALIDKPEPVVTPKKSTSSIPPEMEERLRRGREEFEQRGQYAPPKRKPPTAEETAEARRKELEGYRRQRDKYERERVIPVPPGYEVIEEFPGIKTYVSLRTGRRYTEMDLRRGTLDPPVPKEDFPSAKTRGGGFFGAVKRVLRKVVRFGR